MSATTQMTAREAQTVIVRPVMRAYADADIFFPKGKRYVATSNHWSLGRTRDGRWCATNGRDNGRWFRSRAALDAYARFLTSRRWSVEVA